MVIPNHQIASLVAIVVTKPLQSSPRPPRSPRFDSESLHRRDRRERRDIGFPAPGANHVQFALAVSAFLFVSDPHAQREVKFTLPDDAGFPTPKKLVLVKAGSP